MIISEQQIMSLINLVHEARRILVFPELTLAIKSELAQDFIRCSANVLNCISSQQSQELKEIQ